MKIIIAGGTGLIGSYLSENLRQSGNEVLIVSRQIEQGHISWEFEELKNAIDDSDILINLAGKTINCRHTTKNKEAILKSRLDATEKLGSVIQACKAPPKIWINASASAIYSNELTLPAIETTTQFSSDFLATVIKKWEQLFFSFQLSGTRQVALRTSVVLSNKGGAFLPLYWLSKLGLGGKQGNGKQQFSWIHIEDYYRIILFLIENTFEGIVNCTAPTPITNIELMKTFRKSLGQKIGLPAPELLIKIGAQLIGTESSLVLNSSYMYPQELMNKGFEFNFPTIETAINNLVNNSLNQNNKNR